MDETGFTSFLKGIIKRVSKTQSITISGSDIKRIMEDSLVMTLYEEFKQMALPIPELYQKGYDYVKHVIVNLFTGNSNKNDVNFNSPPSSSVDEDGGMEQKPQKQYEEVDELDIEGMWDSFKEYYNEHLKFFIYPYEYLPDNVRNDLMEIHESFRDGLDSKKVLYHILQYLFPSSLKGVQLFFDVGKKYVEASYIPIDFDSFVNKFYEYYESSDSEKMDNVLAVMNTLHELYSVVKGKNYHEIRSLNKRIPDMKSLVNYLYDWIMDCNENPREIQNFIAKDFTDLLNKCKEVDTLLASSMANRKDLFSMDEPVNIINHYYVKITTKDTGMYVSISVLKDRIINDFMVENFNYPFSKLPPDDKAKARSIFYQNSGKESHLKRSASTLAKVKTELGNLVKNNMNVPKYIEKRYNLSFNLLPTTVRERIYYLFKTHSSPRAYNKAVSKSSQDNSISYNQLNVMLESSLDKLISQLNV